MQHYLVLVVGIAVLVSLHLISIFNGLVRRRNAVENIEGSVDAVLKKRYDLIPNLVSCVTPYVKHEHELLKSITALRAKGTAAQAASDHVEVDHQLTAGLAKLVAVSEQYPDLKANQSFLSLQATLAQVEDQLAAARRTYNAVVTFYNNGIETFPGNVVAGLLGMKHRTVFRVDETQRQDPNVKDLFRAA